MEEKLKNIMSKVFKVSINEITDDFSAHTIAAWDSLKHIDLVLTIEKEYHIRLEHEDIPTMINYNIILNTIKSYIE